MPTSKRRCCPSCFGDRLIEEQYIEQCDPVSGTCDYCGSIDVPCCYPENLQQWFSVLMATYEVSQVDGRPIVDLLKEEWNLFHGSGLSDSSAKELLSDVLDDGEAVRKLYNPVLRPESGSLQLWELFREEMMHKNRWFPAVGMDCLRIGQLLDHLLVPLGQFEVLQWYRARLMNSNEPFATKEMGAPPKRLAGHGRANPAGIPYLYLASTPATSVAELRPHTGEFACVAEFTMLESDLKIADLRNPGLLISPLFGDESQIIELRKDLPFLIKLGGELTRPVLPRGAAYEYIPTQYLCEFIKYRGFHGVIYRSSVSADDGCNLALFSPSGAQAENVSVVTVNRVSVEIDAPQNSDLQKV